MVGNLCFVRLMPWQQIDRYFGYFSKHLKFYFHFICETSRVRNKMENAPPLKSNEANLEELNKRIVEIKRKIVLSGK